jgi:hypothetical protein
MDDIFILHDNTAMPEWLNPNASIHAIMSDGSSCYGIAGDFDWYHDHDIIKAFKVLNQGMSGTKH